MKNLFVIAAAITAAAGSGLGTIAVAHADSTSTTNSGNTKLARIDRRMDHHVRQETHLNQAVRDGTITATQKAAFLTEVKTLHTVERNSLKAAATNAERQAARQNFRASLQSWASTNDFPLSKIFPRL